MNWLRNSLYVGLMKLAVLVAPGPTKGIHERVIDLGMTAYHNELDNRINAGVGK